MKKTPLLISTLCLGSALLFSCAEAPKQEVTSDSESAVEEVIETETMEEEEDFSFMLPSPIQIAAIFSNAGLKFDKEFVNSHNNISNYNTKTSKYLNFGVYSADLAYTVLNDEQQMSIDYLNAIKSLADEIGMPSIFSGDEMIDRFERNIGNQDTILDILTTVKRRTDEYLMENSEESKEAVFFAGAWTEGMFIGANASTNSTHISARLIEQMTIVENIIKGLEIQKDPSLDLDWLINDLTDLDNTFNAFESISALDSDETDIDHLSLTEDELNTLTQKITSIREKIVNG